MQIAPSILSVLNKDLTSILNKVESSGIKYIHLDVMDNIFVPNKTFDDCLIKDLRKKSNLIFDTHLMIEKPELFVENYIDADRKSTRLNSSHVAISYAVFCLKKKKNKIIIPIIKLTINNFSHQQFSISIP